MGIMISYSMMEVGWSFTEAQYFAIGTLSTGGLWRIPDDSSTWMFGVTAVFAMLGVPIMAVAMAKEGIDLVHLIGPGMGHKYHPDSIKEIDRRIDALAKAGRDPLPLRLRFTTWTLRYPTMNWLTVNGLHEHWERAKVDAEIHPKAGEIHVSTTNISALTIDLPPGQRHFDVGTTVKISINGSVLESRVPSDSSFTRHLVHDKQWKIVSAPPTGLVKRPGLQGPIDDAFMDSFMMVKPSGQAWHTTTQSWVDTECTHASEHWRKQFRGVARVKQDTQITDEDIASHNLILWGDPSSNAIIARVVKALPVAWTRDSITVGDKSYAATDHIPTLIYPNPLNPDRYIVFNSGFTFREYDYLNNARQVPKLPDWAIIDITKPVTSRWPGGIADAGFYGEAWELKPHP